MWRFLIAKWTDDAFRAIYDDYFGPPAQSYYDKNTIAWNYCLGNERGEGEARLYVEIV